MKPQETAICLTLLSKSSKRRSLETSGCIGHPKLRNPKDFNKGLCLGLPSRQSEADAQSTRVAYIQPQPINVADGWTIPESRVASCAFLAVANSQR